MNTIAFNMLQTEVQEQLIEKLEGLPFDDKLMADVLKEQNPECIKLASYVHICMPSQAEKFVQECSRRLKLSKKPIVPVITSKKVKKG